MTSDLTRDGRKAVITAFERRMDTLITHPLFQYSISYRRIMEVQARAVVRIMREVRCCAHQRGSARAFRGEHRYIMGRTSTGAGRRDRRALKSRTRPCGIVTVTLISRGIHG